MVHAGSTLFNNKVLSHKHFSWCSKDGGFMLTLACSPPDTFRLVVLHLHPSHCMCFEASATNHSKLCGARSGIDRDFGT